MVNDSQSLELKMERRFKTKTKILVLLNKCHVTQYLDTVMVYT